MNSRITLFGWLCAALFSLMLSESTSASQAVKVPVERSAALEALELAPTFRHSYGSFEWLVLSDADVGRLARSEIDFQLVEAESIRFMDWRFDPLTSPPTVATRAPADAQGRKLALIQFRGPVTDDWLGALEQQDVEVLQYYPHNSYLVWADDAALSSTRSMAPVRWSGDFAAEFRQSPFLKGRKGLIGNVHIHFYSGGQESPVVDAIRAAGAEVINVYPAQPDRRLHDAIVRIRDIDLDKLAQIPQVIWYGYQDPEPILDDESSSQTVAGNIDGTGQPEADYFNWLATIGLDGSGVIWAVTDTGIDYTHPDLNTRIVGGQNYPGCVFTNPGDDPAGGGHGTHVAGIVGGDATGGFADGDGYLYGLGVAPGLGFFAQNPICGSQNSWPPAGGWQELSKNPVLGGAVGTSNSWTSGEGTAHGYQATERTHDIMVLDGNFDTTNVAEPFMIVFSAGNSGPGSTTLTSPKEAKNVVVTASSETWRVSGDLNEISGFSSRGPAVDGRFVPTITAPGERVGSTRNDDGGSCGTPISGTNNLYSFCSGTSMAAPHTSGSLALLTEWWRDNNGGEDPSPAMGKALLINSATDLDDASGTGPIPNFDEGWGLITLRNVFESSTPFEFYDEETTLDDSGDEWTTTVGVVDPNQPLKITLTWSDAPGAVGANPALVNDLDLIIDNGGQTYLGNVFSNGVSTTGGAADTINNAESVFIDNPGGGATIRVVASTIAGDAVLYDGDATDQRFALVCSNCAEQPDFVLDVLNDEAAVCAPDTTQFAVGIDNILGFNDLVTLGLSGNPAGTTASFTPAGPFTPPSTTQLDIDVTGSTVAGSYTMILSGTSTTGTKNVDLALDVFTTAPGAPTLISPVSSATNVDPLATFTWAAGAQSGSYLIEIDDDPAFGSPLISEAVDGESFTPSQPLPTNRQLYWRVTVSNTCGATFSATGSFITEPAPGDCTLGVAPTTIYFDDMESGAPGWTHGGTGDTWELNGNNVWSGAFSWHAEDVADITDQRLVSPEITLPTGALPLTLQYDNHQTIEDATGAACWDAGILEISTDDGASWTQVGNSQLLTDPYDGTVNDFSSAPNPLTGLQGWCGDPQDWTRSIVDLEPWQGETVRFRFRLGTDGSVGRTAGWKIDDVRVNSCFAENIWADGFEDIVVPLR